MKKLGILLSVLGGLMILNGLLLTRTGTFNLSTGDGIQQFIGAEGFAAILIVIGLKMANRGTKGQPGAGSESRASDSLQASHKESGN